MTGLLPCNVNSQDWLEFVSPAASCRWQLLTANSMSCESSLVGPGHFQIWCGFAVSWQTSKHPMSLSGAALLNRPRFLFATVRVGEPAVMITLASSSALVCTGPSAHASKPHGSLVAALPRLAKACMQCMRGPGDCFSLLCFPAVVKCCCCLHGARCVAS